MNNQLLRTAVLTALAGAVGSLAATAADAATYSLHISGASAQRTFWESDLEAIATGTYGHVQDANALTVCTLVATTATLKPAVPDVHTLTCTISANRGATPPVLPTGIAVGDTINLAYEAEFGSVWGIAPFLTPAIVGGAGSAAFAAGGRLELLSFAALPASCAGTQSAVSATKNTYTINAGVITYSRDQDNETDANGCFTANPVPVDIGVSDAEPQYWGETQYGGDNWPVSDGLAAAPDGTGINHVIDILSVPVTGNPSLAQLQTLEKGWIPVNGEVFSVVVSSSTTGPTSGLTNISTQSARSIFNGAWSDWSQVPEANGAAGAIVVCRRDHGSGTQVTSSLYFEQAECGGNNGISYQNAATGTPPRFVSAPTSLAGTNPGNLSQTIGVAAGFEGVGFQVNPIENFSTNDITACLNYVPGQTIGIRSVSPSSSYKTLLLDNVEANSHNSANGSYKYAITTWGFNNTGVTQAGSNAVNIASRLFTDAEKTSGNVLPLEAGAFAGGVWTAGASAQVVYAIQDAPALNTKPVPPANENAANVPIAVWKLTGKSSCTIAVDD